MLTKEEPGLSAHSHIEKYTAPQTFIGIPSPNNLATLVKLLLSAQRQKLDLIMVSSVEQIYS